jgi:hypothetical protein
VMGSSTARVGARANRQELVADPCRSGKGV